MKAIQVRYLGATNYKQDRLKAFTDAQSITVSRDYGMSVDRQSEQLALELCSRMSWQTRCKKVSNVPQQYRDYLAGELIVGTLKNQDLVFCFPDSVVMS